MDFTTRMFLRDYAFLARIYKGQHHRTTYHFAVLSTGLWTFSVAALGFVAVHVAFQGTIPVIMNILTAPKWLSLAEFLILAFCVEAYVEGKAGPFKGLDPPDCLEQFRTRNERMKWWWTTLSIIPIAAGIGGLLMIGFYG